jgi:hypothetical protein
VVVKAMTTPPDYRRAVRNCLIKQVDVSQLMFEESAGSKKRPWTPRETRSDKVEEEAKSGIIPEDARKTFEIMAAQAAAEKDLFASAATEKALSASKSHEREKENDMRGSPDENEAVHAVLAQILNSALEKNNESIPTVTVTDSLAAPIENRIDQTVEQVHSILKQGLKSQNGGDDALLPVNIIDNAFAVILDSAGHA